MQTGLALIAPAFFVAQCNPDGAARQAGEI
jgi:hypothetical protein